MTSVSILALLACLIPGTPPEPPPRDVVKLSQLIQEHPDNPYLYHCRGEGYLLKGEPDKAVSDFNEAIRLDPKNLEYYDAKARAFVAKKDYARALEVLTDMTRRAADSAVVLRKRARVLTVRKDFDAAIADLSRAIELKPRVPEFFLERGDLYAEKKQYEQALADFDQSILLYSENHELANGFRQRPKPFGESQGYLHRGDVWLVQQDYGRAVEEYKQVLYEPYSRQADERIAWIQVSCPDARFRNGQEALFYAKIHYHPGMFPKTDGRPYSMRAAAHAELGEFTDAVEWEKKALEAAKDDPAFVAGAKDRLALYTAGKPYRCNGTDTLVMARKPKRENAVPLWLD